VELANKNDEASITYQWEYLIFLSVIQNQQHIVVSNGSTISYWHLKNKRVLRPCHFYKWFGKFCWERGI
jgi:hypothetical protein